MQNNNSEQKIKLQELGFSDKESSVYIALLELGKGTVSEISKKAGISRTTGYDVLISLSSMSLVSVSGKEPKQEYVAESPASIVNYLKKQKEELETEIAKSESLINELNLIHNVKNRPKIRFYEGKEGLRQVYEDTLTSRDEILAYASVEDVHSGIDADYFPEYYKRRAKKNIPIRAIFPNTPYAIERKKFDKEELRKTLLIPKDKFKFTPEINIYNNKIMIASWIEKLGIIIESEEIADAMKKIYELTWERARQYDEELS